MCRVLCRQYEGAICVCQAAFGFITLQVMAGAAVTSFLSPFWVEIQIDGADNRTLGLWAKCTKGQTPCQWMATPVNPENTGWFRGVQVVFCAAMFGVILSEWAAFMKCCLVGYRRSYATNAYICFFNMVTCACILTSMVLFGVKRDSLDRRSTVILDWAYFIQALAIPSGLLSALFYMVEGCAIHRATRGYLEITESGNYY